MTKAKPTKKAVKVEPKKTKDDPGLMEGEQENSLRRVLNVSIERSNEIADEINAVLNSSVQLETNDIIRTGVSIGRTREECMMIGFSLGLMYEQHTQMNNMLSGLARIAGQIGEKD